MRKDITYFRTSKGVRIDVELLSHKAPYDFFVIEYTDTMEDGSGFYPGDYDSFDRYVQSDGKRN